MMWAAGAQPSSYRHSPPETAAYTQIQLRSGRHIGHAGNLLRNAADRTDSDAAILVAKVSGLGHVAEQADLDDAGEELGGREESGGLAHLRLGEVAVDDEHAVVGDDGPGLGLAHAQDGGAAHLLERGEDLDVREGNDLDRHALLPLCVSWRGGAMQSRGRGEEGLHEKVETHVGAENSRVLAEVRDHDPRLGHVGKHLLAELARATALDGVELGVDPVCERANEAAR